MKTKESSQRPCLSSSPQTRIVIENVYESRAEPNDGAATQMSLLLITTRPFWARASKVAVSYFNTLALGGPRTRHFQDKEVLSNSELWFAKVVCTLFVRSSPVDTCFGYIGKNLNPSIAFEVIRRLNNPKLGLKFFEISRANLSLVHSFRTYDLLMRSLCNMGLHDSAKFVFDCMRSDGYSPETSIIEFLVSSYARVGKLESSENLLDELKCDNIGMNPFVYNSLLSVLILRNQVSEALCLFRKHSDSHFRPDVRTFNIMIRGLFGVGEVRTAFEVLSDFEKFGVSPDKVTYTILIHGLCRANEVDRGHNLLRKLQARSPSLLDAKTFTALISGYCKSGRMEEALALFEEMAQSGFKPDNITFNILIEAFCKTHDMSSAIALFEKMMFTGYDPDVFTFTSLISGHCRAGQLNRALSLWDLMGLRRVSPSEFTFSVLVHALCRDNRLNEARELLRQLNRSKVVAKPFIYNPVVDGFCKAGNLDEANAIVEEMEAKRIYPNRITFTVLVIGNCTKGRMLEAIRVFKKMVARGIVPDELVVKNLASFLNKAGMPNEARNIWKFATRDVGLGMNCSRSICVKEDRVVPVAAV